MVGLQVLCHYEFMIEMGLLMSKNQVKNSMSYVASPHLTGLGEGALQSMPIVIEGSSWQELSSWSKRQVIPSTRSYMEVRV